MPKFEVSTPDGRKFEIDAPEGTTSEQALAYFHDHPPEAATPAMPDHRRWDVIGDIQRDWADGKAALKEDIAAAFPSPQQRLHDSEENRKHWGFLGGVMKDMFYDEPREMVHAAEIPADVAAMVASPFTGTAKATVGSALSYPIEGLDRLSGMKPDDYGKPYKNGFGMTVPGIKPPKMAADELLGTTALALGPEAKGFSVRSALDAAKPFVDAAKEARTADKAARVVTKRLADEGLTAEQIQQKQAEAATTGDKFVLMDLGKNTRGLAGKVYRQPGKGGTLIDDFLRTRDKEVGPQLDKEIEQIAKGSTYDAANHLFEARTTAGHPLFERAMESGSTAPFEKTYERAFAEAGAAERQAQQRLQQARNAQTALQGRASTQGNVYAAPKPQELRAAQDAVRRAEHDLEAIQAQKQRTTDLLRRAQADGTANAPGATWSPRLQELMQDPDIQAGIRRGLKIEKKNALAEGRPFNDRDYAIVGYEENGEPIIGTVPTMKMLAAAKEGMDAIVLDQVHPIGHTSAGRPTKEGLANRKLRDQFRDELVRLNPTYGEALNAWSGPSASIDAMNMGRQHFLRGQRIEEIRDEFNRLSASDKEFYRLGAAEELINREKRTALGGDETKAIYNSRADEERLRVLFDDPKQAQAFLDSIARKRQMFETKQAVTGGSQTAERRQEDIGRLAAAGESAVRGLGHLVHGRLISGAKDIASAGQALMTNERKNEEIAKLLTDPHFQVEQGKKGPVVKPRSKAETVLEQMGLSDQ